MQGFCCKKCVKQKNIGVDECNLRLYFKIKSILSVWAMDKTLADVLIELLKKDEQVKLEIKKICEAIHSEPFSDTYTE